MSADSRPVPPFPPLSHQFQLQALRQRNDGVGHRGVDRVGADGGGKPAIDLQDVRAEVLQVAQRAVAGAEIVDGQHDPHVFQRADLVILDRRQRGAFGQLQHQRGHRVRRQPNLADIVDDVERFKMLGGNVDADVEGRSWREQLQIFRHGVHQIASERNDELMLLGQRNKHVGRDPSLSLLFPTQQHLDAGAAPGVAVDDRLAVDAELAMSDGMADVVRQAHAIGGEQIDHIGRQQADQQRQRDMARQCGQRQHADLRAEQ